MKTKILVWLGISALGSAGCGASAGSTDIADREGAEIGSVSDPLVLDTTTCISGSAQHWIGQINPNLNGTLSSKEQTSMGARPPHCNAWVTQFNWSQTNNAQKMYAFLGTLSPLPTDQTNCNAVWGSRKILGYFGNGTYGVLQDGDFHAQWNGNSCTWEGTIASPSCPTCGGAILQLWSDAGNWIDWPQSYAAIRTINQSMYAYWPIPAWTNLEIHH